MSKLFYDHLLNLRELDSIIKGMATTHTEREELWQKIDEIIHHKVLECILENLPQHHHEEFLVILHRSPHDETVIFGYLKEKIGPHIEGMVRHTLGSLNEELSAEMKHLDTTSGT